MKSRQASAPQAAPGQKAESRRDPAPVPEPPAAWSGFALEGIQHIPHGVQAKLTVSQPDDPLEREADRVADRILAMDAGPPGGPEIEGGGFDAGILRECECGASPDDEVQRSVRSSAGSTDAGPVNGAAGAGEPVSFAGPGKPLARSEAEFFGRRFQRSFNDVRIHDDESAHRLSSAFNARAFTHSDNIFFGRDEYRPGTRKGRRLLAHELTHVVQRREVGRDDARVFRQVAETLSYEWLADRVHQAVSGAGTEEEAIYRALEPLQRDREAVRRLRETYRRRHGESLDEALAEDLGADELEYARQLLDEGAGDGEERITAMPVSRAEFDAAAGRIHDAVSGAGTEEEAVYAVLTSFDRDLRGIRNLQAAYYRLYGVELRDDLSDDLSGAEWSYARYLMGDVLLARSEDIFGQDWEVEHTDVTSGDARRRLVALYEVLTGLSHERARGAVAALETAAAGRTKQLLFALDFLRDNRHVLPPLDMAPLIRDAARFIGTAPDAGGRQFYADLLQAVLYTPTGGNFQIEHRSGDVHGVPGLVRGQTEFRATGRRSSLERPGPPDESPIRGGFTSSLSLQQGFATFAHTVTDQRIERLISDAGDRIDEDLRDAVRVVAADAYFFRLLTSFLERDSGRLVALDNDRGRYVNEERPPQVRVGTAGGVLDTQATLVHEMLHYAFDKADTALGEARESGGADHPAIAALETRFVVIQLIRNGIAPSMLPSSMESTFGEFLASPDLLPLMNAAIRDNRPADLLAIVNSPEFVVTTVSSGLLGEASGLPLADINSYRYTPDQMQDLAAVYAQIAVIVRRAMREAVNISGLLSLPLNEVFARREWIHTMDAFQRRFVRELQVTPTQGVAALGDRIQLPSIPTSAQREGVQRIFNPQQHAAARTGRPVPEVGDPDAFVRELVERGREIRAFAYRHANRILGSTVQLDTADLSSLADIGVREVAGHYAGYMPPGVDLNRVRQRIRFIPPLNEADRRAGDADLSERQLAGYGRSAVRIKIEDDTRAQSIVERHNVLTGGRDQPIYRRARRRIYDENPDEWQRVALAFGGWNPKRRGEPALVQRNVTVLEGDTEQLARRRGRWVRLGTTIHETLHEATHQDFFDAMERQEKPIIGREGFTEYFTRERYADLIDRTRPGRDDTLRLSIEGAAGPVFTPPPRGSYRRPYSKVLELVRRLGGNVENLKHAYFGGHVEYLGLASPLHRGERSPRVTPRTLGIRRKAAGSRKSGESPPAVSRTAGQQGGQALGGAPGQGELPAAVTKLRGAGRPLEPGERAFFESRFGADFGRVKIHDDVRSDRLARRLGARAFTLGNDIAFRSGEYTPGGRAARGLLAHELAHVLQQRAPGRGMIQRQDLEADFSGLESISSRGISRPPRHVSVETPEGRVYAPVRSYRASEVPAEYRGLSIPSEEAATYRSAGIDPAIRRVPEGHVAIGHLVRYERQHAGSGAELIVSIARVSGEFRLVGFDVSVRHGEELREGYVQGGPGVRGSGRVLLSARIQQALSTDVARMRVEMGFGEGTERFHEQIYQTARIAGSPQETPNYTLNVRHMIRLLVAWDETITNAQRSALRRLSEGRAEPTARQARSILRPPSPRGGGAGGGGGTPAPPAAPRPRSGGEGGAQFSPGEYVIHNGRWYEVIGRSRTGQNSVRLQLGGQSIRAAPLRLTTTGGGMGPGLGMTGLSILAALAALVGPFIVIGGEVMRNQRLSIERGRQALQLWELVGARPTPGLWDPENRRPAPEGAHARQTVSFSEDVWFGHHYRPYVQDIDVSALRSGIFAHVNTYQEFAAFLEAAEALWMIEERDGSYFAIVNNVGRRHRRRYDITDIIDSTRDRAIARAEVATRSGLETAAASEQGRSSVFRINRGANVFRSAHGSQPILNAWENFGADPWVRVVDVVEGGAWSAFVHGHYADRLRVEPMNADAYRGATHARYNVRGSINEVWREVRDYGRPVFPSSLPGGRLTSFTAGPHPTDERFGTTTYVPDPELPASWTIATGELRSFWVDRDDLESVTDTEISECLDRGRCGRSGSD